MRKPALIIFIAAVIITGIYLGFVRNHRKPGISGPALMVTYLDDHFGNAVIIKTPEGETLVIDPEPGRPAEALANFFREMPRRSISIVVTNPDSDRAEALPELQDSVKISTVIRPDLGTKTDSWRRDEAEARYEPVPEVVLSRGGVYQLSRSVRLEALHPPRARLDHTGNDTDNNSLVFVINYRGKRFLFPSDIHIAAESNLIASGTNLQCDVLMVGRHGRHGSTSLEMLSLARPKICVISAGSRSDRPSTTILNRLSAKNTGSSLYRTDKDGIIRVETDGRSIQVDTQEAGRE